MTVHAILPEAPQADVGDATRAVRDAVRRGLAGAPRVVLAVSGGLDSMVLLEAAARWARERVAGVATFDHGTGPAATAGARLAAERARSLGLPVVEGRAEEVARDEAGWRRQRWRFLASAARPLDAVVATAHTRDDQLETLVMRVLRDAGARGLAGLAAPSAVRRPLLALPRTTLAAFAAQHGVRHVDDPSNLSCRHLRNRVRLDLLPAIARLRPDFSSELLALGERAAAWRREVDALAATLDEGGGDAGELRVQAAALEAMDAEGLAVLWPALAARRGVTLDRRGTRRLAEFTRTGRAGGAVPLSGGSEVVRRRGEFVLRPRRGHTSSSARAGASEEEWSLDGAERRVGRWRFVPLEGAAGAVAPGDLWSARLPAGSGVVVRGWRPGDRVRDDARGAARRVKRYFKDGRVAGVDRTGWPVVLLEGAVVWIPGVRRTAAATVPSGRPGLCYACLEVRERDYS